MDQITTQLIVSLVAIIASASGFVIAWIESRKRKLEEFKHTKTKNELTKERNGFREHVYKELEALNEKFNTLNKKYDGNLCNKCKEKK